MQGTLKEAATILVRQTEPDAPNATAFEEVFFIHIVVLTSQNHEVCVAQRMTERNVSLN